MGGSGSGKVDIQVYLVGAAGTPDADNPLCAPCIICAVCSEDGSKYYSPVMAMLDSGAYPNAIDTQLWENVQLPIVGEDTLHSTMNVDTVQVCRGLVMVHAPGTTIPIPADFSITPMRQKGHPCNVILGRKFLTQFDFGFDLSRNAWHLSQPASA